MWAKVWPNIFWVRKPLPNLNRVSFKFSLDSWYRIMQFCQSLSLICLFNCKLVLISCLLGVVDLQASHILQQNFKTPFQSFLLHWSKNLLEPKLYCCPELSLISCIKQLFHGQLYQHLRALIFLYSPNLFENLLLASSNLGWQNTI